MHAEWLQHTLTDEEHTRFEEDGYFVVEDAIPQSIVERANTAVDLLVAEERTSRNLPANARLNYLDFVGRHPVFMELLDWPTTFPKVWDLLGWNIQLYHSHFIYTPPLGPRDENPGYNWHKDSGRLNQELETSPQPRISLKIAYFLTDTSVDGRANLLCGARQSSHQQTGACGPWPAPQRDTCTGQARHGCVL